MGNANSILGIVSNQTIEAAGTLVSAVSVIEVDQGTGTIGTNSNHHRPVAAAKTPIRL